MEVFFVYILVLVFGRWMDGLAIAYILKAGVGSALIFLVNKVGDSEEGFWGFGR